MYSGVDRIQTLSTENKTSMYYPIYPKFSDNLRKLDTIGVIIIKNLRLYLSFHLTLSRFMNMSPGIREIASE